MNYEWYPGHMTAAVRMMRENLKLIDLVIELADARIPAASRNPDIDGLCNGKARLLVLGKADLSDPAGVREWTRQYREAGLAAVAVNAKQAGARKELLDAVRAATREKRERNERRGLKNQPVRALVAGIPNVGKSTLINLLAGRSAAKTGNRPGVTRGKQWIQTDKTLQLMDSPGILWPRIGDQNAGELLALVGSMNDDNLDERALAVSLIARLRDGGYQTAIAARYGAGEDPSSGDAFDGDPQQVLEAVARARGCVGEGGRLLTDRAAGLIIDDFRKGKLGGIILERA